MTLGVDPATVGLGMQQGLLRGTRREERVQPAAAMEKLADERIGERNREQLQWNRSKRPLLDGGQGKHVSDDHPSINSDGTEKRRQTPREMATKIRRVEKHDGFATPGREPAGKARQPVRVQARREPTVAAISPRNAVTATPCPTPLSERAVPGVREVQMNRDKPMCDKAAGKNPVGQAGSMEEGMPRDTAGISRNGEVEQRGMDGDEVANAHGSGRSTPRVRLSDPVEIAGLEAPKLDSNDPVTGGNKEIHRKENKRKRVAKQEAQGIVDFWSNHKGLYSIPTPKSRPSTYRGSMCPDGLALHHPAAAKLLEYAMDGCPTRTGQNWTVGEMQEAIERGPHVSALVPEAMEQLAQEVIAKEKKGQCRVIEWDSIKHDPPKELKVSPIAMIPHKSRLFRAILDLSFRLGLKCGEDLNSVNESTEKTAPKGAIDQLGHSLMRMIHAFAQADENAKIFMAKWDIKDGFWRLDCEDGQEWNFAYVLPQPPGVPVKLVVPTSLQMGWIESPPYFCAAAETGRDVAEDYIETQVGSLPDHKFIEYSAKGKDYDALPLTSEKRLRYMVECYVDDYVALAIPMSREQLRHVANAMMKGVHDVFPADDDDENDPLSLKKLRKEEGMWALEKDILGFAFDGDEKTMWLDEAKRSAILLTLSRWIRNANRGISKHTGDGAIPFEEFQSILSKLRHAFISIPQGRGLLSPCNSVLRKQPALVHLSRNKKLFQAIRDCKTLLKESTVRPTKCAELVSGYPDFIGVKDASGHGVGGIIVGENEGCVPTVFRMEWPEDIKAEINSSSNRTGKLTNSDLEMAGMLLLWLVMEEVCDLSSGARVAVFSDNQPTVSWVDRLASKSSEVAGQLLRAMALRMKMRGAAPLTALHIPGKQNAMTDIPSRSWGSNPKWHCKDDTDLLALFNTTFPLPSQASWTVFHPTNAICMKILSVLRMKAISMEEWRQPGKIGKHIGTIGVPTSHLWEWTLSYRTNPSSSDSEPSPDSQACRERDTMVRENKCRLEQSLARSRPLARRSPWCAE